MLFASATHPAMLEYLDNYVSRANTWNENYARELMELHTLGADRHYNEYDVLELSKVLTGWTYNRDLEFNFNEGWHQGGAKTVLKHADPAGLRGRRAGAAACSPSHKGTADFIAEKLCRYLVNDNPPPALVKKVSSTFQKTKGDLPKVYEEIIFSRRVHAARQLPQQVQDAGRVHRQRAPRDRRRSSNDGGEIVQILDKMGQPIYDCTDPTGYYDVAESWMDSGVLTSRWDFCWKLVRGDIERRRGAQHPAQQVQRHGDPRGKGQGDGRRHHRRRNRRAHAEDPPRGVGDRRHAAHDEHRARVAGFSAAVSVCEICDLRSADHGIADHARCSTMSNASRREFLKSSGMVILAGSGGFFTAEQFLHAQATGIPGAGAVDDDRNKPTLVTIFLRGGADSLNAFVPYGDPLYYQYRPGIALKEKGKEDAPDLHQGARRPLLGPQPARSSRSCRSSKRASASRSSTSARPTARAATSRPRTTWSAAARASRR